MEPGRRELRDDEIEAILARLRDDVYGRPSSARGGEASAAWEEAERMWPVSADRPFLEPPGARGRIRGLALQLPKGLLRRLMRWYVEPPLADQRRFNAAVLQLLDELRARLDHELEGADRRSTDSAA
jgi:hypothetical protein